MSDKIAIKIDVTKVLKEHLFNGKNGAKYLDILLIPTPDSKYNDSHVAVQSLPKELRDQGKKGPILGNAKTFGGRPQSGDRESSKPQSSGGGGSYHPDADVPFGKFDPIC
jgi:hypothetical protein